jgi:hypothetical protein
MNNLKYGIIGLGALALIGVFLPFVSFGSESVSLWKLYSAMPASAEWPLLKGHPITHLVLGVVAIAMAGIGLVKPFARWQGIVATVAFVLAFVNMREGFFKLLTEGAIGAKLIFVGILGGLILSILATARPENSA